MYVHTFLNENSAAKVVKKNETCKKTCSKLHKIAHFYFINCIKSRSRRTLNCIKKSLRELIHALVLQFFRFFLHISKISCTFAADFTLRMVAIATKFEVDNTYGYTKK